LIDFTASRGIVVCQRCEDAIEKAEPHRNINMIYICWFQKKVRLRP